MRVYHSTSEEAARLIEAHGFRDASGHYGFLSTELTGVFVGTEPAYERDGASSAEVVLVLDVPDSELEPYWIEEEAPHGLVRWEACVPASTLNRCAPPKRM